MFLIHNSNHHVLDFFVAAMLDYINNEHYHHHNTHNQNRETIVFTIVMPSILPVSMKIREAAPIIIYSLFPKDILSTPCLSYLFPFRGGVI